MYNVKRNEPCPCGSGRKYKHCCFRDPEDRKEIKRTANKVDNYDELKAVLKKPSQIIRLKIKLVRMRVEPIEQDIYRTVEVVDKTNLHEVHLVIQDLFNWDNDHLYSFYMGTEFQDKSIEYAGNPMGGALTGSGGMFPTPPAAIDRELRDFDLENIPYFWYRFDYGDELIHKVFVMDVRDKEKNDENFKKIDSVGQSPEQYPYIDEI